MDLEITGGEFLALMTPSGAGKTTMLNIMNLLQTLGRTQGKITAMVIHDPRTAEFASRELHLDRGKLARDAARRAA